MPKSESPRNQQSNRRRLLDLYISPYRYIEGFRLAADLLAERIRGSSNDEEVALLSYPVAFLNRHYVELMLKYLIEFGRNATGIQQATPQIHKLVDLWVIAQPLLLPLYPRVDFTQMARDIETLSRLDPVSQTFRYWTRRQNSSSVFTTRDEIDPFLDLTDRLALNLMP